MSAARDPWFAALWSVGVNVGDLQARDEAGRTVAAFYEDKLNDARAERDRARHLAAHLFQMIPERAWRDTGGDDGQGHYEGDYRAEQIATEIRSWSANSQAQADS